MKKTLTGYSDHDWWIHWDEDALFPNIKIASAAKLFKHKKYGKRKYGTKFKRPVMLRITIEEVIRDR